MDKQTPNVSNETVSAGFGADDLQSVLRDYMDVTQRLQKTHETLQREVVRLRKEVHAKDIELERRKRLALLGELAAGMAHEIRNPLGAIRLCNGMLRTRVGDSQTSLGMVDKIEAGIRDIDCVIEDALALAPRRGVSELRSLREVVEGACDACRAVMETCGVGVAKRFDDPEVCVPTDGAALNRVFVNLVANALQASPENSVVSILVGAGVNGYVKTIVSDDGPGLPDDVVEKIFEPFFTTKKKGTGLGLTIAHRLVEAHGGSLVARNKPEGGAEFIVTLPTNVDVNKRIQVDSNAERTSAAF